MILALIDICHSYVSPLQLVSIYQKICNSPTKMGFVAEPGEYQEDEQQQQRRT